MTFTPNASAPKLGAAAPSPPDPQPVRPFSWSVRRELWENRWVAFAPVLVAVLVLVASLFAASTLPRRLAAAGPDEAQRTAIVAGLFGLPPAPVMLATFLVGFFYCLDALYGERRDRSVLFWKSQPVSDRTTVLAKLAIPLLVLPVIGIVLGWLTQLLVMTAATAVLLASGRGAAELWTGLPFFQSPLVMLYGVAAHAIWFAPIHGWLLMVSAWARRAPLLWALLPPLGVAVVERIAVGTSAVRAVLRSRLTGAMGEAFSLRGDGAVITLSELDPLGYLASPGLWAGLFFASVCIAAAIWLRHRREPLG